MDKNTENYIVPDQVVDNLKKSQFIKDELAKFNSRTHSIEKKLDNILQINKQILENLPTMINEALFRNLSSIKELFFQENSISVPPIEESTTLHLETAGDSKRTSCGDVELSLHNKSERCDDISKRVVPESVQVINTQGITVTEVPTISRSCSNQEPFAHRASVIYPTTVNCPSVEDISSMLDDIPSYSSNINKLPSPEPTSACGSKEPVHIEISEKVNEVCAKQNECSQIGTKSTVIQTIFNEKQTHDSSTSSQSEIFRNIFDSWLNLASSSDEPAVKKLEFSNPILQVSFPDNSHVTKPTVNSCISACDKKQLPTPEVTITLSCVCSRYFIPQEKWPLILGKNCGITRTIEERFGVLTKIGWPFHSTHQFLIFGTQEQIDQVHSYFNDELKIDIAELICKGTDDICTQMCNTYVKNCREEFVFKVSKRRWKLLLENNNCSIINLVQESGAYIYLQFVPNQNEIVALIQGHQKQVKTVLKNISKHLNYVPKRHVCLLPDNEEEISRLMEKLDDNHMSITPDESQCETEFFLSPDAVDAIFRANDTTFHQLLSPAIVFIGWAPYGKDRSVIIRGHPKYVEKAKRVIFLKVVQMPNHHQLDNGKSSQKTQDNVNTEKENCVPINQSDSSLTSSSSILPQYQLFENCFEEEFFIPISIWDSLRGKFSKNITAIEVKNGICTRTGKIRKHKIQFFMFGTSEQIKQAKTLISDKHHVHLDKYLKVSRRPHDCPEYASLTKVRMETERNHTEVQFFIAQDVHETIRKLYNSIKYNERILKVSVKIGILMQPRGIICIVEGIDQHIKNAIDIFSKDLEMRLEDYEFGKNGAPNFSIEMMSAMFSHGKCQDHATPIHLYFEIFSKNVSKTKNECLYEMKVPLPDHEFRRFVGNDITQSKGIRKIQSHYPVFVLLYCTKNDPKNTLFIRGQLQSVEHAKQHILRNFHQEQVNEKIAKRKNNKLKKALSQSPDLVLVNACTSRKKAKKRKRDTELVNETIESSIDDLASSEVSSKISSEECSKVSSEDSNSSDSSAKKAKCDSDFDTDVVFEKEVRREDRPPLAVVTLTGDDSDE